jgi:hypothetical protein
MLLVRSMITMSRYRRMASEVLVDIEKYRMFNSYPTELVEFCETNSVKLPKIESLRGQAYALMAQPDVRGTKYITRKEADAFFTSIGIKTDDSIQPFNKSIGLKRVKKKGSYCLVYPFETDLTDIEKRKGCSIKDDRDLSIEKIKKWWLDNLVNVPNEEWQVGHLDPTLPDASEHNLAYQPPIQGKYRNRFKWDSYFQRMWPTGDEWVSNMDNYHTEVEQRKMLEALKKKFQM